MTTHDRSPMSSLHLTGIWKENNQAEGTRKYTPSQTIDKTTTTD